MVLLVSMVLPVLAVFVVCMGLLVSAFSTVFVVLFGFAVFCGFVGFASFVGCAFKISLNYVESEY